MRDAARRAAALGRSGLVALSALLAACGADLGELEARTVVLDPLEVSAYEVLAAPPDAPPELGAIAPSIEAYADAGELPALVLHPPSRVALSAPRGAGPLRLVGAAGVDLSLARALPPGAEPLTVRFEVRVDGERVYAGTRTVRPRPPGTPRGRGGTTWSRLGGGEGIPLAGGERIELSTEIEGTPPLPPGEIVCGFGGLAFVRVERVPRGRASAERPNLVLFVVDTERLDRTGLGGSSRPTTPHADALAARGVRYARAYSTASWTWPATASLLTGLPPEAHGVESHRASWLGWPLETLAEVLQREGYTTAGFSANPLVNASRNFDQGFETFHATADFADATELLPRVLEWLEANAERRFFLFVQLTDPHWPHRPHPAEVARLGAEAGARFPDDRWSELLRAVRARLLAAPTARMPLDRLVAPEVRAALDERYDACVASADRALGELLGSLEALGLSACTVVARTADHGEELFDHEGLDHAHALWPELVRVPLVLAGPGVPAGEVCEVPVSNRHLAPTLARLGGARLPAARDALDLARPAAVEARAVFVSTHKGLWGDREMVPILGVRRGRWAFDWAPTARPRGAPPADAPEHGEWRLFDLDADPAMVRDVAPAHPDVAEALRALVSRHAARWSALRPRARTSGAGTWALLSRIGYAGEDEAAPAPAGAAQGDGREERR